MQIKFLNRFYSDIYDILFFMLIFKNHRLTIIYRLQFGQVEIKVDRQENFVKHII